MDRGSNRGFAAQGWAAGSSDGAVGPARRSGWTADKQGKIVTISTDNIFETKEFRASAGAQWTFPSDADRKVQKDRDIVREAGRARQRAGRGHIFRSGGSA